jgi:hypothetical protein
MGQDFHSSRWVRIRKPHLCHGCGNKHFPGRRMEYSAGIFEGDFYTYYLCEPCKAFCATLPWDTFSEGFEPNILPEHEGYTKFREAFTGEGGIRYPLDMPRFQYSYKPAK